MPQKNGFPQGFHWGVATSSYQIEGAAYEDGRKESIWDIYAHTPGLMAAEGHNGDVACDHYHRWPEDVALMKSLGVNAYRFSIAWPRILPDGRGQVNEKGLDFYNRLTDSLLKNGITPMATLYHWDLPAALDTPLGTSGWLARSTAEAFAEYTQAITNSLGDRVKHWATINEPWCASFLGYFIGTQAPGVKKPAHSLRAAHHLLLAHGLAIPIIRANSPGCEAGIVLNPSPVYAGSNSAADLNARRYSDGIRNRWYLDPLYGRGYPVDMLTDFQALGYLDTSEPDFIQPGDMEKIASQTDFLGINYYSRSLVEAIPDREMEPGILRGASNPTAQTTASGWEVYPDGLYDLLVQLDKEYHPGAFYIAENGAYYDDVRAADGSVDDSKRLEYVRLHLMAASRAIKAGVKISGYYLWSFLDNFEWRFGYNHRFGIVYIDFDTLERIPKKSALWYAKIIQQNGTELD